MKYNFTNILDEDMYETARVMFVIGKYSYFNNMVVDTLKERCLNNSFENAIEDIGVDEEFGIESTEKIKTDNIDFNTFLSVVGVANITGKWYCRTSLEMLTSKQIDKLDVYVKSPSENGILIITCENYLKFKDYTSGRKSKLTKFNKVSHLIDLSWPNKKILKNIVYQAFQEKGIEITLDAAEFFVIRMSSAYDEYEELINNISEIHKKETLDIKDIKEYMKGIENFVIDDLYDALIEGVDNKKTGKKKVYKMIASLEDEVGASELVRQIKYKVDEAIDFRIMINKGIIPIGIDYSFKEIQDELGKDNKYAKYNEWRFRRSAEIASRLSIRDWQYIQLILNSAACRVEERNEVVQFKSSRALYEIANRYVLNKSIINNSVGLTDIFNKDIDKIDRAYKKKEVVTMRQ